MGSPETKERILAAAKDLFLSQGYAGTTVDAICAKAKLTKGSFYYFFKSKEDLGLAVMEWTVDRANEILGQGSYAEISEPIDRAFGFLEHLEKCAPQIWRGGCLLGTFAAELAESNPRMQKAVSSMFQAVSDGLAHELQPIAARANGRRRMRASELADTLLGIMEGSIILGKAHRDSARLSRAIRRFRVSMEELIEQPVK
jgi:TetR/AcrR family transcriptional regulator, transcriptional repressor for nem operon